MNDVTLLFPSEDEYAHAHYLHRLAVGGMVEVCHVSTMLYEDGLDDLAELFVMLRFV